MGQDFQKLQEYKSLGESLTKVWGFINDDDEIELYDNLDVAMAAARLAYRLGEEVEQMSVRTGAFWQLHKDLFLAEVEEELEEDEALEEAEDEVYFEDEPHPYTLDDDLGGADDDDDGGHMNIAPKYGVPATRPTTVDIQARLKDLAKFKSALPQKQPATTVAATPVQTSVQADEGNDPVPNNDGRLTCYACGEPTKIVDTGFSTYCVCTVCGR